MPLALRLYLPPAWTDDAERLREARVPDAFRVARSKGETALAEIDRAVAAGVRFSAVLAGTGCGISAAFRRALSARGLTWAVGIPRIQKVFPTDVAMVAPPPARRPSRQPLVPAVEACAAEAALTGERWRTLTWRQGTKGALKAGFAARRVRVADGAAVRLHGRTAQYMLGEEVLLVGERRASGECKYYLSNLPARTTFKRLAATIKARCVCEQAHQQLKEELGLDHFEGRSWIGLHRHALLSLIAYLFLQSERPAPKKYRTAKPRRHNQGRRNQACRRCAVPCWITSHAPSGCDTHNAASPSPFSKPAKVMLEHRTSNLTR